MKRLAIVCVGLMAFSLFMVLNNALTDWHSDCYFYADCGFPVESQPTLTCEVATEWLVF